MSYQVLARKWRPKTFAEMVGQTQALQGLIHALDQQRLHHAYLFTGTRGVGKTSIARILAKCLNCEKGISSEPCGVCGNCQEIAEGRFADLIEIDAASRTKVEDTREILDNVQYAPTRGRYKVYLIDEVHMLSGHSFNALLKTLEEPPPHVKFLLATTDPQKLPVTVLSRCLQFNLKNIPAEIIATHLSNILAQEQIAFDAQALTLISRAANGSLRDALSLLDQAIAYGQGQVTLEMTATMLGTIDHTEIFAIVEALQQQDGKQLMACAASLAEKAADFSAVLAGIARLLYQLALSQTIPGLESAEFSQEKIAALAQTFPPTELQVLYQIAITGRSELGLAPDPRVGFEMTLLRMLAFRPLQLEDSPAAATPQKPTTAIMPPIKSPPASGTGASVQVAVPVSKPPHTPQAQSVAVVSAPEVSQTQVETATVSAAVLAQAGDWATILNQLPLNGIAKQFALNCVMQSLDANKIVLLVDEQHGKMLNERVTQQIEVCLQKYFNNKVKLSVQVGQAEQETPAAVKKRIVSDKMQAAEQALMGDKNVHFIQKNFHAIIDKNSIKPRE